MNDLLKMLQDSLENAVTGSEVKDIKKSFIRGTKWAVFGDKFATVPETVDTLPPGYYKAIPGGLSKVVVNRDEILALPSPEYQDVLREISKFWESEEKYRKYGVAYKRGILLYGPPGTGKTTLLRLLLANVEKEGGIALEMGDPNFFIDAVTSIRTIQPKTPIIAVMEDLEVWFGGSAYSRTGSTLLSVLDGMEGLDKVLFLATTNHPDLLEERVTNRPSRFDRRINVSYPQAEARKAYVEFLFRGEEYDPELWVNSTEGLGIAHIKEIFISHKVFDVPFEDALTTVTKMKDKISAEKNGTAGFRGKRSARFDSD